MSELQLAIVHKSLGRIPLEILTRAVKETVKKGGMGEGLNLFHMSLNLWKYIASDQKSQLFYCLTVTG